MPQSIVNLFETVKVKKYHRAILSITCCRRHCLAQSIRKQMEIGQPGETIIIGELEQMLFFHLTFADIAKQAAYTYRFALRITERAIPFQHHFFPFTGTKSELEQIGIFTAL